LTKKPRWQERGTGSERTMSRKSNVAWSTKMQPMRA